MGRPRGAPTTRKEFRLETWQVQQLEALKAAAPLGEPSLVSLVRQAVSEFISREMAKPHVRTAVDAHLKQKRRVVILSEVRNETKDIEAP